MSSTAKILVVDDEKGIRDGCSRVLQPEGFAVSQAATIREGLESIQTENFDLLLLDVMMPDGRGLEMLEPVRAKDPDTVCIIITGFATVELAVEAIKHGAYDFIAKPFTADQLLLAVNQGLEKRQLSLEAKRLQQIEQQAHELARNQAEMERLDQQKSAFMTIVAHELRAPIAGAQSLLRTILRGLAGDLTPQQQELLARVQTRLDMLLELVNDLLDLAASKTLADDQALAPVDLAALMQKIVNHFEVEARGKNIRMDCSLPQGELLVWGLQEGLERIFANLVSNAIKYTPDGGTVSIILQEGDGQVRASITDTGIGIPQEDLPMLFSEFFRAGNAKRSGISGTGLGLSIVHQLVGHFGGQIDVTSQEGQGTTFTVSLQPAVQEVPGAILI